MEELSIGDDVTMRPAAGAAALGRIDQYELVRELGGGGFGCVYLARDTVAGIDVAVKGLPPEVRHNKEEQENIRENFAFVSRLHHPNIAAALVLHPVRDVTYASRDAREKLRVFEGDTLMVMEYAPGTTLSSWRKQFKGRCVPPSVALDIVRQIASALDYAHERKIVHRDIKPANIMIETRTDGSLVARVLDFGLAAEIRSSMGRVSREIHDTSGTRPYMAPEQWAGEKQGPATDQYSLAVLLHELVAGSVPHQSAFDSGDPVVMLTNVVHRPVTLSEAIPPNMRLALLKALAKKPSDRFARCSDFVSSVGRRPFPWHAVLFGFLTVAVAVACWWRFVHDPGEQAKQNEFSCRTAEDGAVVVDPEPPDEIVQPTAEPDPLPPSNYWHGIANVPAGPARHDPVAEEPLPPLTNGCTVSLGKSVDGATYRSAKGISRLKTAVDEAIAAGAKRVVFSPAEECARARVSADSYAIEIAASIDRLRGSRIPCEYRRSDSPSEDVRHLDDAAVRECRKKPISIF